MTKLLEQVVEDLRKLSGEEQDRRMIFGWWRDCKKRKAPTGRKGLRG
jgi:hypothetical protein